MLGYPLVMSSQHDCHGNITCSASVLRALMCPMQIARVLSGFFLVLQLLILLEFVYIMNEWLLNRVDSAWAKILLALSSILCYIIALGIIVVVYIFYAPSGSCGLNIFFITWTLIMGLALTGMSVRHFSSQTLDGQAAI